MFTFLQNMWAWLPSPLPDIFTTLLICMFVWVIVRLVIAFLDLIPFI